MMLSILLAVALDLVFKEPPNNLHPTAWMGRMIQALWRGKSPENKAFAFLKGILIPLLTAAVFGGTAGFISISIEHAQYPDIIGSIITGFLLYLTISFSKLLESGRNILIDLKNIDLPAARHSLSYNLVSRDTSKLNENEVCAATLESISENLTDGLTAPILMFMVFGLPGAVIYRVINTCDSMLGYRDSEREWLGKFSARLDDAFNFIPARITALVLNLEGVIQVGPHRGFQIMIRDHGKTKSPNAGWTMAALAGILNVRLEKKGYYILNPEGLLPGPVNLLKGISICRKSGFLFIIFILVILQGTGHGI